MQSLFVGGSGVNNGCPKKLFQWCNLTFRRRFLEEFLHAMTGSTPPSRPVGCSVAGNTHRWSSSREDCSRSINSNISDLECCFGGENKIV